MKSHSKVHGGPSFSSNALLVNLVGGPYDKDRFLADSLMIDVIGLSREWGQIPAYYVRDDSKGEMQSKDYIFDRDYAKPRHV